MKGTKSDGTKKGLFYV